MCGGGSVSVSRLAVEQSIQAEAELGSSVQLGWLPYSVSDRRTGAHDWQSRNRRLMGAGAGQLPIDNRPGLRPPAEPTHVSRISLWLYRCRRLSGGPRWAVLSRCHSLGSI